LSFAITLAVLLAVAGYAASRRSARAQAAREAVPLPPPPHDAYFGRWLDEDDADRDPAPALTATPDPRRVALLESAAAGEVSAFDEALKSGDDTLLLDAVDALAVACSRDDVQPLAARVASEGRPTGSVALARRAVSVWRDRPGRRELTELLVVAAVAGDADVFDDAVEAAAGAWQSGALAGLSADDLLAVCERHFRTMPDAARNSGPGFVVKRRLAQLSRTLAAPEGR